MSTTQEHGNQVVVTQTDVHAILSICAIILFSITTVAFFGRIFTKFVILRKFSLDDLATSMALLLFAGQTGVVLLASQSGLGVLASSKDEVQANTVYKYLYVSNILLIASVTAAKLSVISFVSGLVALSVHGRVALCAIVFVLVLGLVFELAAAFQCQLPEPWTIAPGRCYHIPAFWVSFNVFNIATEVFLICWPSSIIIRLHASIKRRAIVVCCFATRLLVIGAITAQIVFSTRVNWDSDTLAFDLWPLQLSGQVMLTFSIITASIPALRPFLESLESGMLRSDNLRRRAGLSTYAHMIYTGYGGELGLKPGSRRVVSMPTFPLRSITSVHSGKAPTEDSRSVSSQARIIKQTISWSVQREPGGASSKQ